MTLAEIRKYFLSTTVLGCLWIILSAFFGWQVIGLFGSIVFMLFYIGAYETSSRQAGSDAHLATFANSLYFQGFLLTVWALIISLVAWGALNGGSITSADVLSRIGIALVTTFVGLGGRTLYIQFYESPDDVQRAAQHGLTEKSAQLAGELSASVQAIRAARTELTAEIDSMRKSIESAKADQEKSVASTAKLLAEAFHKDVESAMKEISESQIKQSQEMHSLTTLLNKSSVQLEAGSSSLAEAGKTLLEVGQNQKKYTEELLTDQVITITKNFEILTIDTLGRIGDIVEGLEAKIVGFSIDDSAITDAVKLSWTRFSALSQEIESSAQQAASLIKDARAAINSVSTGLADVSILPEIVAGLSEALNSTSASAFSFRDVLESLAGEVDSMDSIMASVKSTVEDAKYRSESIPLELKGISDEIVRKSNLLQEKFDNTESAVSERLMAEVASIDTIVALAKSTVETTKKSVDVLPRELDKISEELVRKADSLQEHFRGAETAIANSVSIGVESVNSMATSAKTTLEVVKHSIDAMPAELSKISEEIVRKSDSLQNKLSITESAISELNETIDQGAGLLAEKISRP